MYGVSHILLRSQRKAHTWSYNGPSEALKKRIAEQEKKRKNNPKNNELFVAVPESVEYLDTLSMPMVLTAVAVALFSKILMMERIERKIKNAPADQGTVRMLDREEWEYIQEVRPRTPFESRLARRGAQLRTDETLHMEDVKDWTIDVLTDAFTRAEDTVWRGAK
ncbi:hypothetical protein GIB67_004772 [Kingdonia uniflora]|uniref:Uncharacterized protein n=1 Tax=Kingdonia uniflora TaxID=39325 RepID=A0A7J7LRL8_9MAGN|nr:hypothetical protein GIB67_004772 [Kingdonia uniflora]